MTPQNAFGDSMNFVKPGKGNSFKSTRPNITTGNLDENLIAYGPDLLNDEDTK